MNEDCLNTAQPDQFLPMKNILKIKLPATIPNESVNPAELSQGNVMMNQEGGEIDGVNQAA